MLNNYLEEKIKFIRGMPKSRKQNFENIFFLQFGSVEICDEFGCLFQNIKIKRDDIKFGHEYILNSLNNFDLILLDKKEEDITNSDLIKSFLDILNNNGEIWFFCEKKHDIKGDILTKEIEKICFDNEIHFYKCSTHSKDFPIDVIMINKNKNNFK